jgi:hypothetical protein
MGAQAVVGSEAGKLSGHDVRRWAAGLARTAVISALTYGLDNLAGLGLSPAHVLVISWACNALLDLMRRAGADTRVIPVEPAK